jgi:hypothetical protein
MTTQELLAAYFDPGEVEWLPAATSGNKALAIAYVDARAVMDRLDKVLGATGWQDDYDVLPAGQVVCHLRCKINDEWVAKTDVGGPSDQKDVGDKMKSAFSDALKRAAVKFGVGRYLYSLPQSWVDYDPVKKKFATEPKLPAWAIPKQAVTQQQPPPTKQADYPPPGEPLITLYEAEGLLRSLQKKDKTALAAARGAGVPDGFLKGKSELDICKALTRQKYDWIMGHLAPKEKRGAGHPAQPVAKQPTERQPGDDYEEDAQPEMVEGEVAA